MSFDLDKIAAAIKAIPRSERPYSIRDASPTDLMSDLGPFILAEAKRAIAEEREACAKLLEPGGDARGFLETHVDRREAARLIRAR
jgi:hypothetical protein